MGKFVEWYDTLSVGIEEIDERHKMLVDLVNKMHEAIHQGHGSDVVKSILGDLAEYTHIHFAVEESLMRILNYPGYDHYKKIHEELLHSVSDLQEKVATGKTAIGFELMYFLKTWLTKHIMEEEMQYTGFFFNAGAQAKLSKKSRIKRLWRS
ncbi:MAG: bacteriohemerythrin [Candidatus Thiodiazotropha sp. (ex Lucinoma aequizonata)]|nr:bacteriohemerythrin [Candidatus Thiodiazotropha sp. (ex Lucinoma aequizonata)]MCU7889078.1 bacteriohemerythrin [Candidatus Thiodiazotropha sp. (ex Lucinoma aequizonata)]MCU7894624.1 bacteriohemerythrin [Candidatus Thiodiazotropha sp. (ex Lucinoma aequizonata)]MCU7909378.1 bacteriohemerythrin [Candidatus Thiodiazotropha sp. (ex Lucinoma aequizonata)]MCU7913136.1 bacteriohemerythrin [Candidatus Thiodiazotropha sp. (ex Lucinoma aequizonata)]